MIYNLVDVDGMWIAFACFKYTDIEILREGLSGNVEWKPFFATSYLCRVMQAKTRSFSLLCDQRFFPTQPDI